jgi:hypothetical protein
MKRIAAAILLVLAGLAAAIAEPAIGQAPARWPMPAAATPLAPDEVSAPAQPSNPQAVSGPLYAKTYGGFEFRPTTSDMGYNSVGNAIYATTLVLNKSFRLPINLPTGAQVITVTFFLVDDDPVNDMNLAVISYTADSTSATSITNTTTAGMPVSTSVQSLSFASSPIFTVDNASSGYALRYGPIITGTLHELVGARVYFTLPISFLPVVQR